MCTGVLKVLNNCLMSESLNWQMQMADATLFLTFFIYNFFSYFFPFAFEQFLITFRKFKVPSKSSKFPPVQTCLHIFKSYLIALLQTSCCCSDNPFFLFWPVILFFLLLLYCTVCKKTYLHKCVIVFVCLGGGQGFGEHCLVVCGCA